MIATKDWFIELIRRTREGPRCKEKEFETRWLPSKLRELAQKYDITYDPTSIFPNDNQMADNVFKAGIELIQDKFDNSFVNYKQREIL